MIITLRDVNDNYPVFAENYMPVIYENEKEGLTVVTVSGIDKDTASNGPPFDFWLPCHGECPCSENPTCNDFAFSFIEGAYFPLLVFSLWELFKVSCACLLVTCCLAQDQ